MKKLQQRTNKATFWNKNTALAFIFFAVILWVAHYFHFRDLGFYEDDYAQISPSLTRNLKDIIYYFRNQLLHWNQGRPLQYTFTALFSFLGKELGGLHIVYVLAYLVQLTNACLFYLTLKKISNESIALIGGLTFGLFPADTTHTFLMHAFALHISLTFILIATLLYLDDHKTLAYCLSLGSLITYEPPYLIFLAIPLLTLNWKKQFGKELIRHILIWLGILLIIILVRVGLGEQRIVSTGGSISNVGTFIFQMLQALFIGPAVSLWLFLYGPGQPFSSWNRELTIIFIGFTPIFLWVFWQMDHHTNREVNDLNYANSKDNTIHKQKESVLDRLSVTAKLILTSLVMLCFAYGFSFTHFPPTALFGRMTSVHLAATFGGSLFFACICSLLLSYAQSHRKRGFAALILAMYFSLLVTYRFSIQLDFKQAWKNQQWFWTNVIEEIPDQTDGTIIFVLNHDLPTTHYIITNSWADPIILNQIYDYPDDWQTPPRLFVVPSDWTNTFTRVDDQFQWMIPDATWAPHWETMPDSNIILLEMENGDLVRRYGSLTVQDYPLHLKSLDSEVDQDLAEGALYPYLIPAEE